MVHASFAEEKIRYVEKTGYVIHKSQLHRACLHIPDPYEVVIRNYGHYALRKFILQPFSNLAAS